MSKIINSLHVRVIAASATKGVLQAGGITVPCSLGRAGARYLKREGDGATPRGAWQMRRLFYRGDRMPPPRSGLAARPMRPHDGWCETVGDRNYNRLVRIPYATAHETLMRRDHLYDIVVELSHNRRPRVQGLGSAVFLHLRRENGGPTAGCIALSLKDMRKILALCGPRTRIFV